MIIVERPQGEAVLAHRGEGRLPVRDQDELVVVLVRIIIIIIIIIIILMRRRR